MLTAPPQVPTPLPTEYIPTAIALTLQANGIGSHPPSAPDTPAPTASATPESQVITASVQTTPQTEPPAAPPTALPTALLTATVSATQTVSPTTPPAAPPTEPIAPTATQPAPTTRPPATDPVVWQPPTATAPPEIPFAAVQIYRLGELSRILSPLRFSGYLSLGTARHVSVELYGEDGRLLVRQLKDFKSGGWPFANIDFSLDFEISAAAEVGRLVVSVENSAGQIVALNSVDLLLMTSGETELNPASAIYEAILIQQPASMTLIQGGQVLVSGVAQVDGKRPLRVQLVDAQGQVVGQRLASVEVNETGGWGPFVASVPYEVQELTQVRLVVFEDGAPISPISHLSSLEIFVSP